MKEMVKKNRLIVFLVMAVSFMTFGLCDAFDKYGPGYYSIDGYYHSWFLFIALTVLNIVVIFLWVKSINKKIELLKNKNVDLKNVKKEKTKKKVRRNKK